MDDDDLESLFGPPSDTPVELPSDEESFGDLFGPPPSDNTPSELPPADEDPLENLFNDAPAEDADPNTSDLESLFGMPSDRSEEASEINLDDLFGTAPRDVAGVEVVSLTALARGNPLADTPVRIWIDNSGRFQTEGRVIAVQDGFVRLLKTNGKTCTVPNQRLCEADFVYVESLRSQLQSARIAMLSGR